ncbi:MAG: beta-N-acetylhexosaminidase [Planctomycetes bacterium]|nr:beta-N-acetylhexosaminidase [Planctomycetota bacterium]
MLMFSILAALALLPTLAPRPADDVLALVPEPVSVVRAQGTFTLDAGTQLYADAEDIGGHSAAESFGLVARPSTGFALALGDLGAETPANSVVFTRKQADAQLGMEGYSLEVSDTGAVVRSLGAAGLLHGAQTLLQLFPPELFARSAQAGVAWSAPGVVIRDAPRFVWRGLMLDVSRHFMTKDEVERVLDQMVLHKLNVFHWHLVDDHGWRIEIKDYPKLTQIGAWRGAIGFGLEPKDSSAYDKDGRYGGFYTQDEIREVVAYAAARQITVVPEIEMPGHSVAALAAYPQFSCTGGPFDVNVPAGVHAGIYCPGNEATFGFLQDVLTEVLGLFPGPFVHLGGDEVPREEWTKCARCKKRMQDEKLGSPAELQSWFLKRIEKFVNGKGKRVIGWDEILDGGLAPNAAVMSWRGTQGGLAAASAGHDVVMCPNESLYLDHAQALTGEPLSIGGFTPLDAVYAYEPVPEGLSVAQQKHVLGAQGNLWTEYVPNAAHAEYMLWPRACAVAELCWTPRAKKDFGDFERRMDVHKRRLSYMGVHYRPLPPAGLDDALAFEGGSPPRVSLAAVIPGATAKISFDGSDPDKNGAALEDRMPLPNGNCRVRARIYRPDGNESFLVEALVVLGKARVRTTLGQEANNGLERAFDLDEASFFWTNRALRTDDHLTLELFGIRTLKHARVTTGDADKPLDRLQSGVLEVLPVNGEWKSVADFTDGKVDCDLPPEPIRAVRLRCTASQPNWLRVHEFTIQ